MMTRLSILIMAAAVMLAVGSPADAAHRHKRKHAEASHAETGPLIMSGTMAPYGARRTRASAAICKPITIRVR